MDLGRYVDLSEEVRRLEKALEKSQKEAASHRTGLENPDFVGRAPPEKVEEKRRAMAEAEERARKIGETLTELREVAQRG